MPVERLTLPPLRKLVHDPYSTANRGGQSVNQQQQTYVAEDPVSQCMEDGDICAWICIETEAARVYGTERVREKELTGWIASKEGKVIFGSFASVAPMSLR